MKTLKKHRRRVLAVVMVMALLALSVVSAFAQSTTTLDISTSTITNNLFTGANVILGALLGIVMLIAGFRFGSNILDKLAGAIKL